MFIREYKGIIGEKKKYIDLQPILFLQKDFNLLTLKIEVGV